MALFDFNKLESDEAPIAEPKSKAIRQRATNNRPVVGKANSICRDVIGPIVEGETIHYVSQCEWSKHDILFHVLDHTGPADVYAAIWSIHDTAMNQIIRRIGHTRDIRGMFIVLDHRSKTFQRPAFEQLKRMAKVIVTECHAKVVVAINDTWGVTINGSANLAENPRIESGVISADRDIALWYRDWIISLIKTGELLK